jgi:hypothetical protein
LTPVVEHLLAYAAAVPAETLLPVKAGDLLALAGRGGQRGSEIGAQIPAPVGWLPASADVLAPDLTLTEVAKLLKVTPATVRSLCVRGELVGAYQLRGATAKKARGWRVPATAVEAYRANQQRPAEEPIINDLAEWLP